MTVTNPDVYASLIEAVKAQLDVDAHENIKPSDTFKSIGLDSMSTLCVMRDIESKYSIDIPDEAISIENTLEEATDVIFCLILNK